MQYLSYIQSGKQKGFSYWRGGTSELGRRIRYKVQVSVYSIGTRGRDKNHMYMVAFGKGYHKINAVL